MNPLTDVIPAAYRRYIYAAYALAGVVLGAMQVAGVDVLTPLAVYAYLGVPLGATAASNTGQPAKGEDGAGEVKLVALVALGVIVAVVLVIPFLERTF